MSVGACGAIPSELSAPASYALSTIGGKHMPVVFRVVSPAETVSITGGSLDLGGTGRFVSRISFTDAAVGVNGFVITTTDTIAGFYTQSGNSLALVADNGVSSTMQVGDSQGTLAGMPPSTANHDIDTLGTFEYRRP